MRKAFLLFGRVNDKYVGYDGLAVEDVLAILRVARIKYA